MLLLLLMLLGGSRGGGLLLLLLLSQLELLHGCDLCWRHAVHCHHVLASSGLLSSHELSLGNLLLHGRHLPHLCHLLLHVAELLRILRS